MLQYEGWQANVPPEGILIKVKMEDILTSTGKLKDDIGPAVYFDTSVIIDHWLTEGADFSTEEKNEERSWADIGYGNLAQVVRDLLKTNKRLNKVTELRQRLITEDIKVVPVTTHLALWELQEWYAESGIKQLGSEISGAMHLQKKGKKEIGDYLKNAYQLWQAETEEDHHDSETGTSGLELLSQQTWINWSFAYSHGLRGILIADIKNFNWPPKKSSRHPFPNPGVLAYLQLGAADILHVTFANHLGCQYFASYDSDFRRAKTFIEETGLKVLLSPEEIISVL